MKKNIKNLVKNKILNENIKDLAFDSPCVTIGQKILQKAIDNVWNKMTIININIINVKTYNKVWNKVLEEIFYKVKNNNWNNIINNEINK